jgi:hypothetical protein
MKPENDSLDKFLLRLRDVAQKVLRDIPHTSVSPTTEILETVSLEFKRNILLLYKELSICCTTRTKPEPAGTSSTM